VTDWTPFTECKIGCGISTVIRKRSILHQDTASGGKKTVCPALLERRECMNRHCKVPCVVSSWSAPSECSTSCGPGTTAKARTVITNATWGGKPCPVLRSMTRCHAHLSCSSANNEEQIADATVRQAFNEHTGDRR
jgi:hypothetical protein